MNKRRRTELPPIHGRKTTRRVRVRVDFVVEFDRDLGTLPIGGPDDMNRLVLNPIGAALRKSSKRLGIEALLGGARVSFGLDFRKPEAKGGAP